MLEGANIVSALPGLSCLPTESPEARGNRMNLVQPLILAGFSTWRHLFAALRLSNRSVDPMDDAAHLVAVYGS